MEDQDYINGGEDEYETYVKNEENEAVARMMYNDFIISLTNQLESTTIQKESVDIFELLICNMFGFDNSDCVEDCSIHVDERMDLLNKSILASFVYDVTQLFESTFGITIMESNISTLYSLYKAFCLYIIDTFIFYLCGLSKLDEGYREELPNYDELSFDYFVKNIYKSEPKDVYSKVREYVEHIISNYIIPDKFIEIALLESSGNLDLSNIFIEQSNYRITYDEFFIIKKISKMLSSEHIVDLIIDKFIDINNLDV